MNKQAGAEQGSVLRENLSNQVPSLRLWVLFLVRGKVL